MPKKALALFLSVGVIWGTPYFFIEIAIEHFQTPSIVFLRVFLGALILLPIAMRRGMLRNTLRAWPAVLAFAVFEMVGPWYLITEAERSINSSLAGLLITTVPFIAAFLVGLLVNQIQNFIQAALWFTYWGQHDGSLLLWIAAAYGSYLLGLRAAEKSLSEWQEIISLWWEKRA